MNTPRLAEHTSFDPEHPTNQPIGFRYRQRIMTRVEGVPGIVGGRSWDWKIPADVPMMLTDLSGYGSSQSQKLYSIDSHLTVQLFHTRDHHPLDVRASDGDPLMDQAAFFGAIRGPQHSKGWVFRPGECLLIKGLEQGPQTLCLVATFLERLGPKE